MSLEDAWHARPQLFFKCLLCPQNGRPPKNPSWTHGPNDIKACLVFFSAFEELKLQASGPIDSATTKLYEQSPTPIMYVAPCELMLGRVPHFPCSLQGNATPGSRAHHTSQVVAPQGSRPARFSTGSQMQPLWMAVGGATSTRSTHGCGSLGAGGLAWGVYLCLRLRRGARRSSGLGRRGVKRPAAAARQLGAEMNETYGPGTSGGISQDIPGYASL